MVALWVVVVPLILNIIQSIIAIFFRCLEMPLEKIQFLLVLNV